MEAHLACQNVSFSSQYTHLVLSIVEILVVMDESIGLCALIPVYQFTLELNCVMSGNTSATWNHRQAN